MDVCFAGGHVPQLLRGRWRYFQSRCLGGNYYRDFGGGFDSLAHPKSSVKESAHPKNLERRLLLR